MRLASTGSRRLTAFLLLAVFLGAGTTLPGPDALLYHWGRPDPEQHRTHVEAAGGCGSHLEGCSLGRAATGAEAVTAAGPLVRIRLDAAATDPGVRPRALPVAYPITLSQPRAPPIPVA